MYVHMHRGLHLINTFTGLIYSDLDLSVDKSRSPQRSSGSAVVDAPLSDWTTAEKGWDLMTIKGVVSVHRMSLIASL